MCACARMHAPCIIAISDIIIIWVLVEAQALFVLQIVFGAHMHSESPSLHGPCKDPQWQEITAPEPPSLARPSVLSGPFRSVCALSLRPQFGLAASPAHSHLTDPAWIQVPSSISLILSLAQEAACLEGCRPQNPYFCYRAGSTLPNRNCDRG